MTEREGEAGSGVKAGRKKAGTRSKGTAFKNAQICRENFKRMSVEGVQVKSMK